MTSTWRSSPRRARCSTIPKRKVVEPLALARPGIALELPLRILVWEADDGRTRVGYLAAQALVDQFELDPARIAPLGMAAIVVDQALTAA